MPQPDKFHWARATQRSGRVFRQAYSCTKVQAIAAEMGIPGRSKMREEALVAEILGRRG